LLLIFFDKENTKVRLFFSLFLGDFFSRFERFEKLFIRLFLGGLGGLAEGPVGQVASPAGQSGAFSGISVSAVENGPRGHLDQGHCLLFFWRLGSRGNRLRKNWPEGAFGRLRSKGARPT